MGTSGAFGGSGSTAWKEALEAFEQIAGGNGGGGDPNVSNEGLNDFWDATKKAITAGDKNLRPGGTWLGVADILPNRRRAGGGAGIAGSRVGPVPAKGTRRSASAQIGRGAVALSAAYGLATGDTATLRALGIDASELTALSARDKCQRILDLIIGQPGHPDDEALRNAVQPTLIAILEGDITDPAAILRQYLANFCMEMFLVQLSSRHGRGDLSVDDTRALEREARDWIGAVADSLPGSLTDYSPQGFVDLAQKMASALMTIHGDEAP